MLKQDKESKDDRVKNLEGLYEPVSKLSVIFKICLFLFASLLALTGHIWTRVDRIQDNVTVIVVTNKSIEKSIAEIRTALKEGVK
jgi:hypothetical protein